MCIVSGYIWDNFYYFSVVKYMFEQLSEKIPVFSFYNPTTKVSQPLYLKWQGKLLTVTKIGLHHTISEGKALIHVFCIVAGNMFFKLHFDTTALTWTVKEISDGNPT